MPSLWWLARAAEALDDSVVCSLFYMLDYVCEVHARSAEVRLVALQILEAGLLE